MHTLPPSDVTKQPAAAETRKGSFVLAFTLGVATTVLLTSAPVADWSSRGWAAASTAFNAPVAPSAKAGGRIPTLGEDVAQFLLAVNSYVEHNVTGTPWPSQPTPLPPVSIPFMDRLVNASRALNANPQTPEEKTSVASKMLMVKKRLGRATDVGNDYPPMPTIDNPILDNFPDAHHFHQRCGMEWYYIATKLPVREPSGQRRRGEVSFLISMERTRAVSVRHWEQNLKGQVPGWETDDVNQIGFVVGTVTARFFNNVTGEVEKTVYATNEHSAHWGAIDPDGMQFSVPGEPFGIRIGNFSLTSLAPAESTDILPLRLSANDPHFAFDFTIHKRSDIVGDAFFLQGFPEKFFVGSKGTGFSFDPTPGIYYSWPQLSVYGATSLIVDGETVDITGVGNGWIDHQLMAQSLLNPVGNDGVPQTEPIPFRQDASPVNGWMWQFCNSDNGTTAWTGASFVVGNPELSPLGLNPYGYYLDIHNGAWRGQFTAGATLSVPVTPAMSPAGASATTDPYVSAVPVPNSRTYWELRVEITATGFWAWIEVLQDFVLSSKGYLSVNAEGWYGAKDPQTKKAPQLPGDFNNGDFSMAAETPATFKTPFGEPFGWGYLETVGFEPTASEETRQLHYIETDIPKNLQHVYRTGA